MVRCASWPLFLLISILGFQLPALAGDSGLQQAVNHPSRTPEFRMRDRFRHPKETLSFFQVQPDMTVVEIWPGPGGWYTEILAPYLRGQGRLYGAQFNADSTAAFYRESRQAYLAKLEANPDIYAEVVVTTFNPPEYTEIAPEGTADKVLTFRNVHNWYMRGGGDERVLSAFLAMYRALKPGGILGVVEHRLPAKAPLDRQEASGYMREDYVVDMVEKAGFQLLARSEVNANPRDTADHPKGVWTLPPSLRLGDKDRDKYLSIGESDRMTLKFRKPEQFRKPE